MPILEPQLSKLHLQQRARLYLTSLPPHPGKSKRQRLETGSTELSAEPSQLYSEGLEALLEAVRQKGSYHPTEDVRGDQKAFLAHIAESAMSLSDTVGDSEQPISSDSTKFLGVLGSSGIRVIKTDEMEPFEI